MNPVRIEVTEAFAYNERGDLRATGYWVAAVRYDTGDLVPIQGQWPTARAAMNQFRRRGIPVAELDGAWEWSNPCHG